MSTPTAPIVGSLELFRIGLGPSSSHTVGPMRAAKSFVEDLVRARILTRTTHVTITLYGSLGATGEGHGTHGAIVAGLSGSEPETCDPDLVRNALGQALSSGQLALFDYIVPFREETLRSAPLTRLPLHSNGIKFSAWADSQTLLESIYYSVGGGFIEKEGAEPELSSEPSPIPYPFGTAHELVTVTRDTGLSIAQVSLANDFASHGTEPTLAGLSTVWRTMVECVESGLATEGTLPGSLRVPRRAKSMAEQIRNSAEGGVHEADWLQAYAIAVNEENAAGNRVVTAPTNGAAGIIPAVGYWAKEFFQKTDDEIVRVYLPTASAIGSLYKNNASISGAEAGCQGEVGSACSMAAAGVTALMGGTAAQIENAAEIAMEHNLGLTCDPVGGYVQLPCIERNAIAAGTAVAAMRLAMLGDGSHRISLDTVIETMRQTGLDMSSKYKETSTGGLAVNVIEC